MVKVGVWLLVCGLHGAFGWGGVFNRFSPEMLSNLDYGHSSASKPFLKQGYGAMDTLKEMRDEASNEVVPCYGRRCSANEHCCPGLVCIIIDGYGSCLFPYGMGLGELCRKHSDCDNGLLCLATGDTKTCQHPFTVNKQYSEECSVSSECDTEKGLCCQLQRRHRQAARKVCLYFKDPLVCIGSVAMDQIKILDAERTSGEKRITGNSFYPMI